jgi:hypothetical protein
MLPWFFAVAVYNLIVTRQFLPFTWIWQKTIPALSRRQLHIPATVNTNTVICTLKLATRPSLPDFSLTRSLTLFTLELAFAPETKETLHLKEPYNT